MRKIGILKKSKENFVTPVTQSKNIHPFTEIGGYVPLGTPRTRLYYSLREAVPLIDSAILKLVRLTGGFKVECKNKATEKALASVLEAIPVGGNRQGIYAFIESYFEQLLTVGTAVGEIVTDTKGNPRALFNSPENNVIFKRAENGFDIDIFVDDGTTQRKIEKPELCLVSVLNPEPGALRGNSILKGLPFITDILLKIYESIGVNWERAGNIRYAVTYNPGNGPMDRAYASDRARMIADEWAKAMKSSDVRDFVAVGDVQIKVIGAENHILDSEVPVRQMLEQIVAKTGLPPFMLGLSWSTTERMSSQQADALTSELEAYRRILTPVIVKICKKILEGMGVNDTPAVKWDDITLQDELDMSKAALYRAQAENLITEKGK